MEATTLFKALRWTRSPRVWKGWTSRALTASWVLGWGGQCWVSASLSICSLILWAGLAIRAVVFASCE